MSVWGHSSLIGGNEYVIFASDRTFHEVVSYMQPLGINYKVLFGFYKGEYEVSYMVRKADYNIYLQFLTDTQECIMLVGPCDARDRRPATLLWFSDGIFEDIGKIRSVSHEVAMESDAWSYDPQMHQFFVAKKES